MTPADRNHIQIRCPSCSQKFKVGTELMGRIVECGGCENRFEVTDEVITKGDKFYPGERDPSALSHFHRVEGPSIGVSAATPAVPGPHQEKGYYSPITRVSGFRIVMGWVGAVLILGLVTLLLLKPFTWIAELAVPTQVMVAVIGGVIGVALLAFANPRTIKRTLPIAAGFAALLLAVPFVFHSKMSDTPSTKITTEVDQPKTAVAGEEKPLTIDDLKKQIGIAPLEIEVERLKASGKSAHAYGIWLRDMSDSNRISVRDYMIRMAVANPGSIIYTRDKRDYLMVLTGVDKSLEEVAEITSKIALKQVIRPELNLIEVKVDASVFLEGPLDKLTDKQSPAFYDLNKRELESIQLERVGRAVRRLADAEPTIYRKDITRLLIGLLLVDQVDFQGDVARALLTWAEDPQETSGAALMRLKRTHDEKKRIPTELVELLAKSKTAGALPIVKGLWMEDLTNWERFFGMFGPVAEPALLDGFQDLDIVQKHSAVRLLGQVGSKASLPVLEGTRAKGGAEINVLIDNAEKSINERN